MATTNAASFSYLSSSSNRLTGLASGMDIDSIVEKLMKAESAKMEKLQQQKQKYEWQRDSYRSINTKLEAFRTEAYDKYKPSSFLTKSATVSDSSKLSVTASSSASGSLTITNATLANSGIKISDTIKNPNTAEAITGSTKLKDLNITNPDGEVKVKVIQKDGTLKETSIKFNVETDTVEEFVKKVNSSGAGLTAVFSGGKMSLTANATGNKDGLSMEVVTDGTNPPSSDVFEKLGLADNTGSFGNAAIGQNATYTVNGIEKTSSSNTFSESGYTITLNKAFKEGIDGSVSISSTTDKNAIADKVKSFVELYNGLIESLNSPIKEKKNYNYPPLTDAQKAEMSEDEIKKWEEKAKLGTLRNDTAISAVVSNMRTAIYSIGTNKDGKYNTLYNIGITTSDKYTDGGKLVIDEDKLMKAIEENPDAIADLFTRSAEENGSGDKGGLITQLRSIAKTGIDSIAAKAGKEGAVENSFTLGKNLISIETKISDWQKKLKSIEERYFKQFSAMEQAIQKANSQSSLFAQG